MCFNPRPCARGDIPLKSGVPALMGFNPRPCARGDSISITTHSMSLCFNPRPCARGDRLKREGQRKFEEFQSTPLREGRQVTLRSTRRL